MSARKTKEQISAIYAAVASSSSLLYHVAHARKGNSDKDYDGESLKRISDERARDDIARLRTASEIFRQRSIPRD